MTESILDAATSRGPLLHRVYRTDYLAGTGAVALCGAVGGWSLGRDGRRRVPCPLCSRRERALAEAAAFAQEVQWDRDAGLADEDVGAP